MIKKNNDADLEQDALLEAALDPEAYAERVQHLVSDPATAHRYETARRALELVDQLPRPEPSAALRRGLWARLDEADEREAQRPLVRLKRWLMTPLGGGFALAAAAAAALVIVSPGIKPHRHVPAPLAQLERIELAKNRELYENLELIEHLDIIEDLELIDSLPEESG